MKTMELRSAMATIYREAPGRYDQLEKALAEAPREAQYEFARLMRTFESKIATERRRARSFGMPWRG